MRRLTFLLAVGLPLSASAQIQCNRPVGPDVMISDIVGIANYPAANGRDAFSVGSQQTDVGNVWINYSAGTPAHPVIAQNLFRLSTVNGAPRFEQIGQSWLFHGFCALASNVPCNTCTPPPDCSHLGVGCSSIDAPSRSGTQVALGPRWQVNPSTGVFAFPPANPPFSGAIARRLQASLADLNTTDQFFVETLVVAADDAAALSNTRNNATYRQIHISGGPTDFTAALVGGTWPPPGWPAIRAWGYAAQPGYESQIATGEGFLILSSRPTAIGGGLWHYEYALYNMNSDAGVGTFSVPLSDSAALLNVGFHDVAYTDGDGINGITRDGADWTFSRSAGTISWRTTPFAADPNANALLWGTLYNFRFDTDRPPTWWYHHQTPMIALWKTPGVVLSAYAFIPAECYANCDGSTTPPTLNVLDFACFMELVAAGDPAANCDGSTTAPVTNVLDFVCFLNRFSAGCS